MLRPDDCVWVEVSVTPDSGEVAERELEAGSGSFLLMMTGGSKVEEAAE